MVLDYTINTSGVYKYALSSTDTEGYISVGPNSNIIYIIATFTNSTGLRFTNYSFDRNGIFSYTGYNPDIYLYKGQTMAVHKPTNFNSEFKLD